jgi:hypothetical protein
MDGYPLGSLDHNVPLLVVSGLSSSHDQPEPPPKAKGKANGEGVLLRSDLPPLEGKEASFLESFFERVNERGKSWTVMTREEPYRVRVKTVGRVRRFCRLEGHHFFKCAACADCELIDLYASTSTSDAAGDNRTADDGPRSALALLAAQSVVCPVP